MSMEFIFITISFMAKYYQQFNVNAANATAGSVTTILAILDFSTLPNADKYKITAIGAGNAEVVNVGVRTQLSGFRFSFRGMKAMNIPNVFNPSSGVVLAANIQNQFLSMNESPKIDGMNYQLTSDSSLQIDAKYFPTFPAASTIDYQLWIEFEDIPVVQYIDLDDKVKGFFDKKR